MGPVAENETGAINNRRLSSDARRRHERMDGAAALLATLDGEDIRSTLELTERLQRMPRNAIEDRAEQVMARQLGVGGSEAQGCDAPAPGFSFEVTLGNLEQAMRYQPWMPHQHEQGDRVREALTAVGRVFLRELGDTPLRRRLLEELLQLRMLANMAISFPRGF